MPPFNVDFPHLILRARAIQAKRKGVPLSNQVTKQTVTGVSGVSVAVLRTGPQKPAISDVP